jgi:hypothetical protein
MRRLMAAMCCVCLMGAAGSAQMSMDKDKDKMAKDKMDKPITVTGCVAAGSEAGHYTLTNGMMAGDSMSKSYDLIGGDVKAHVGHKIEVTGVMDKGKKMGKDAMAKDTMDKDRMSKDKMGMSEMHDTLQVKSVKMIASTCQ